MWTPPWCLDLSYVVMSQDSSSLGRVTTILFPSVIFGLFVGRKLISSHYNMLADSYTVCQLVVTWFEAKKLQSS